MKQKHLSLLLLLLSMLMIPTGSFAASPVRLFIKGSYVQGDVAPMIVKDRTLVPLRLISETLNYDVTWNGADRSVRIVQNDRAIDLKIGSTTAYALQSGTKKKIAMDVAPIIVKDRTLVPLRFISENFGEKVDWDGKSRTVIIGEGYSPRTNPDALTIHFRNKTFNIEAKMYRGQTMIPAEDFAKAMSWNYVKKLNEYEEKVPCSTIPQTAWKFTTTVTPFNATASSLSPWMVKMLPRLRQKSAGETTSPFATWPMYSI